MSIKTKSLRVQTGSGSATEPLHRASSDNEAVVAWVTIAAIVLLLLVVIFGLAPLVVKEPNIQEARSYFLDAFQANCNPEPLEHFRWLCAISIVPALWTVSLLFQTHASEWLRNHQQIQSLATVTAQIFQLVFAAFLIFNLTRDESGLSVYWCPALMAGLLIIASGLTYTASTKWIARQPWSSSSRRLLSQHVPIFIALVYTLLRVLPGVVKDVTSWSPIAESHFGFSYGEFCAILNGKTVLVDYFPQYQNLSEYMLSPLFSAVGLSPLSFSLSMVVITIIVLVMVFRVINQFTHNWWLSLLSYLPFSTAATFPLMHEDPNFYSINYYVAMPLRYIGPFLVALLCLRYLRKPSGKLQFALFFTGAIASLNNLDFGIPALAAALATVIVSSSEHLIPQRKKLLVTIGLFSLSCLLAVGCFSALTFLRSHQLPDVSKIADIQQMWVMGGYGLLPVPAFGIHWNVYVTFMAGLLWSLRFYSKGQSDSQDSTINGLLFFSSVFGCGAMTYFVGRSAMAQLVVVFTPWAFTLILLSVTVWKTFSRIPSSSAYPLRTTLKTGLVPCAVLLLPMLLFIGSGAVASPSLPAELKRLFYSRNDDLGLLPVQRFIQTEISPGDRVAISHPYGFHLANSIGIRNYFLFTIRVTSRKQFELVFTDFAKNDVKHVFMEIARKNGAEHFTEWRTALRDGGYYMKNRIQCSLYPYSEVEHWTK